MNQIQKLRYITGDIGRKLCSYSSIPKFNYSVCMYYKLVGMQPILLNDSSNISSMYSFNQIRNLAKRAQGKAPKGNEVAVFHFVIFP